MDQKTQPYTFEIHTPESSTGTNPPPPPGQDQKKAHSFAGENRTIRFNLPRASKYYAIDIVASLTGFLTPLFTMPCWGRKGAQNMMYAPKSTAGVVFLIISTFFAATTVLPLVELIRVATGTKPQSHFSMGSEGVLIIIFLCLAPVGSAMKYGLMSSTRFHETVLGENKTTGTIENNSMDTTADSMAAWASPLKDDLLERELALAMWRSGDPSDGETLKFTAIKKNGDSTSLEQVSLNHILRSILDRNRSPRFSRPMKLKTASFFLVFAPYALIPSFFRRFHGLPFFGSDSDSLEIAACVGAFLSNLQYVHWFFWAMFHTTGHLNRQQDIEDEYHALLTPALSEHVGTRGEVAVDQQPVATVLLAPTAENVKIWDRGRRCLLLFGHGYWLRLSFNTACTAFANSVLLVVVVVQLVLSLLSRNAMQITSFIVMVCLFVLIMSSAFAFVVLAGMKLMRHRKEHRTLILREANKLSLGVHGQTENTENEDVGVVMATVRELRSLAWLLESELTSHKVKMLGMPLNSRMLESLFGGVIAVGLVVYQVSSGSGGGVTVGS
jgi:hypothetical protein